MKIDAAYSWVCECVIRQTDNNLVGYVIEKSTQQRRVRHIIRIIAEADDGSSIFESKPDFEVIEPLEIFKSAKLAQCAQHFTQQASLLTAHLLREDCERAIPIENAVLAVFLLMLNRSAEKTLHIDQIFLDTALSHRLKAVIIKFVVHFLCPIVNVIIMMVVREQSVQDPISYECILVCRHISNFCCKGSSV